MDTLIYDHSQIAEIAEVLKAGGMVAIPTDTVFGLAVSSRDLAAIEKMKVAKGRPESKPFPMMVSNYEQLEQVAVVTAKQKRVIEHFMPGALTVIFQKSEALPAEVTNGFKTVGIRMPDDLWVLQLIELVGCPLLVPSANLSGQPAGCNDTEVLAQLSGRINGVVKGVSGAKQASTIVDMSNDELKIVREGVITLQELQEVV